MENNIVIAKFKKWNIFSLIPLFIGILSAVIFVLVAIADEDETFFVLLIPSAIFIIEAFIIKSYYGKLTLTITDKWIFSKRWFGKKTSMPIEKVSFVSTGVFKRISIHSDGGKLTLWGCKNDEEVFCSNNLQNKRIESKN